MTTLIVTENGMWADGRVNRGGIVASEDFEKAFCYKGYVVGVTGQIVDAKIAAMEYIDNGKILESLPFDGIALMMKGGNIKAITYDQNDNLQICHHCPDTYGSGGCFATAALDFGKTPEEAIKYAATRDVYTNDNVFSALVSDAEQYAGEE